MTAPKHIHLMDAGTKGRVCAEGQKANPTTLTLFWPAVTCDRCKAMMARGRLR